MYIESGKWCLTDVYLTWEMVFDWCILKVGNGVLLFLVPNVELSPLCSPNVRPGPPVLEAQVLSCNLADVIKRLEVGGACDHSTISSLF